MDAFHAVKQFYPQTTAYADSIIIGFYPFIIVQGDVVFHGNKEIGERDKLYLRFEGKVNRPYPFILHSCSGREFEVHPVHEILCIHLDCYEGEQQCRGINKLSHFVTVLYLIKVLTLQGIV